MSFRKAMKTIAIGLEAWKVVKRASTELEITIGEATEEAIFSLYGR